MRGFNILIVLFTFFLFLNVLPAQYVDKDFQQIEQLLYQQQEDWNKGDIDAFMEVYWKSPELQFGGANGITKGWQNTLDGYKNRYPDKVTMGTLSFDIKDLSKHSRRVVSLTGSWDLKREIGDIGGHFLLIWRKIKGDWVIVVDHTSSSN